MIDTGSPKLAARLGVLGKLELLGQTYFVDKSPFALSAGRVDAFVRYLPWAAALFLPVNLALVALALGVTAFAARLGHASWLGALMSLAVVALDIAALPGLFRRSRQGWSFITLAMLVCGVRALLGLDLFGIAASAGCLWLMFQVRDRYRV